MNEIDPKIAYLQTLHEVQEAHKLIVAGVQLVVEGGVEGVRHAAEASPELIITAIKTMADLLERQRLDHLEFVEMHFKYVDRIDSIIDSID